MTGEHFVRLLSAFCLAWLGLAPVRADEPNQTAPPDQTASAAAAPAAQLPEGSPIDLAILLDEHLAILRLQVRRGTVPVFGEWQQFIEGKFAAADKDHDGVLNAEEFPTIKPLLPTATNANNPNMDRPGRRRGQSDAQLVADPMTDEIVGGKLGPGVTSEQFVEALRTTTHGPVQISAEFRASPASRALFARLDADHDDKLSSGECERAFEALQPIDLVEADLFGPFQLTGRDPGANVRFVAANQAGQTGPRSTRARLAVKLMRFSSSASSVTWADRIRQHFAPPGPKEKTARNVSRAILLYDEATFGMMDADGGGTLDQEELTHLTRQPTANLELNVDLSQGTVQETAVRLDRAFRFDPAIRANGSSRPARLATGVEELEIAIADSGGTSSRNQGFNFVSNLKQFDRDNNDYLDERELRQFNATGLMALDANGDGKLFFDEIEVFMDAQAEAAPHRLVVSLVDHDHTLFDALDTNRDGQLGRRELRQLTTRLTAWDRNGDGQLAFDEVPRLYSIRIAPDEPRIPSNPFGFGNGRFVVNEARRVQTGPRPTWFIQMDRNGDGDISRREFLGTAAQFRQLDVDGDQLIDADEATRAAPTATVTTPDGAPAADEAEES